MFKKGYFLVSLFILVMFTGMQGMVYGSSEDLDQTESPYFIVEGSGSSIDSFPLKSTEVDVTIDGVIANVFVRQTYRNDGTVPLNATYVFPASTKASVHGMKMTIGDKVVYAQIKEKGEATQEFEQAKSEGKSASLLQEDRPNVFTMKLANIMPGDEVLIELNYSELIVPTDGVYQFVYPTVVGPRYVSTVETEEEWVNATYLLEGETDPRSFHIEVALSSPIPIDNVVSPSHVIASEWISNTSLNISLGNEEKTSGNRDFILEYTLSGKQIQSGLLLSEGEEEKFFLLMVQPPERVTLEEIPPREYIFVLDVSGSMFGYPLETAKVLINDLIGQLNENDKFNIIFFAGGSTQLWEVSLPATDANRLVAIECIDAQTGGGGTELASALIKAIKIPADSRYSRSVVVISDGYISEEKEIFSIIESHLDSANYFSFGIGSSVNRYLIEGIGKAGQGEAFIVTEESEAKSTVKAFREYIASPLLTNIEVNFNGLDVYDVEPKKIPDMFSKRPLLIYGKWKGELTGSVEITGQTGTEPYLNVIDLSTIVPTQSEALPYLWARKRIERLSDYNLYLSGDDNKAEITELGLKYTILTQYTSFIAVLDEVRNIEGNSTDVNQPLPLPENVTNYAIGYGASMSEPEDFMVLVIILGVLLMAMLKNKVWHHEK